MWEITEQEDTITCTICDTILWIKHAINWTDIFHRTMFVSSDLAYPKDQNSQQLLEHPCGELLDQLRCRSSKLQRPPSDHLSAFLGLLQLRHDCSLWTQQRPWTQAHSSTTQSTFSSLGGSEAEEHGRGSNLMLGALSPSGFGWNFLTF